MFREHSSLKQQVKVSIYELKKSRELKLLFILSIVNQVFFQTHFQLWQALFLEKRLEQQQTIYSIYIISSISNISLFCSNSEF